MALRNSELKALTRMKLADVAKARGVSAEDAAIDLVIKDRSRVAVAHFMMSERNARRQTTLDWVSFGSDAPGVAPEGVFLMSSQHPRAYGNFARLFAKYVREEHTLSIQEAVRRLTSLPADTLSLLDRGRLRTGAYADIVIFDPTLTQDHATFAQPHQLAGFLRICKRKARIRSWPSDRNADRSSGARSRMVWGSRRRVQGISARLDLDRTARYESLRRSPHAPLSSGKFACKQKLKALGIQAAKQDLRCLRASNRRIDSSNS